MTCVCVCMCVLQLLRAQSHLDGVVRVVKMLQRCPGDWRECVCLARVKFEKYFNHKVTHTHTSTQHYLCGWPFNVPFLRL